MESRLKKRRNRILRAQKANNPPIAVDVDGNIFAAFQPIHLKGRIVFALQDNPQTDEPSGFCDLRPGYTEDPPIKALLLDQAVAPKRQADQASTGPEFPENLAGPS
jgi:hypothetical protein